MNRLYYIIIFLGVFAFPMFKDSTARAQTVRYYVGVARYNGNGVKSEPQNKGMYLAFINNNSFIYICDKNGNKLKNFFNDNSVYKYRGTRDGTLIYQAYCTTYYGNGFWGYDILYFTPDLKRLNWKSQRGYPLDYTDVYELGAPGNELKAPDTFY